MEIKIPAFAGMTGGGAGVTRGGVGASGGVWTRVSGRTARMTGVGDSRFRGNDGGEGGRPVSGYGACFRGNDGWGACLELPPASVAGSFDEEEACACYDHQDGAHCQGACQVRRSWARQIIQDCDGHRRVLRPAQQ